MRLFYFFSFLIIFLLLTSSIVAAIGVSPPKYDVDYQEGKTLTFNFGVLNKANAPTTVQLTVDGAFAKDVKFSEDLFDMKPRSSRGVDVTVTFPDYKTLTAFNKQKIKIHMTEVSQNKATGGFAALTAVQAWIVVQVPVPGTFGEIRNFDVENVVEGLNSTVNMDIVNLGTDDLRNTRATVDIFNFNGDQVSSIDFWNVFVKKGETTSLSRTLSTSIYPSGKYIAKAKYYYDEESVPMPAEKTFFIGSTNVIVTNYTADLIEGQINKVDIHLQSLWGSSLTSIRGEISDFNGHTVPLPVIDLDAFQEKIVTIYLDTPFLNSSAFRLNTDIYNSTQKELPLSLSFPVESANDVNKEISLTFTVHKKILPEKEQAGSISTTTLVILVGFVVFILLALNMFLLMGKKKSQGGKAKNEQNTKKKE